MNRTLVFSFALMLFASGVLLSVMASRTSREPSAIPNGATSVPDESAANAPGQEWLKEYTLTERSGKKFQSNELVGKVHVVNFFFAKCPTVCRTQTAAVKALEKEFGPLGVVFLSITVDPANDTPAALALYAKEFDAHSNQWLFLTGDMNYLRRVGAEVYYMPVDKEMHSEKLLVLDKQGKIRESFSWKRAEEVGKLKNLLTELLSESESAPAKSEPQA